MARNDIIVTLRLAGEEFSREFDSEFNRLEKSAEEKSRGAGRRSGAGFAAAFGAGLAGLGTIIGVAVNESAELGASIASTSRQFNIGAEELQVWRFAAQQAGVTSSEFDGSLADLTRRIGEANAGNTKAQQSFVDLGLSFQTASGDARATDAVMLDLAARIAAIEDPSERVRLGTQLLGEEFSTLYPLLLNGADGFNAASAEIDRFGGALSAEEIKNLQETNAKIEQMKNALATRIAGVVAENADAIGLLGDRLFELADAAVQGAAGYIRFADAVSRYKAEVASLPDGAAPGDDITRRTGVRARRPRGVGEYIWNLGQDVIEQQPYGNFDDRSYLTDYGLGRIEAMLAPDAAPEQTRAPFVSPAPSRGRGGGSQRTARTGPTAEDRAAQAAIRAEEQLREAIERTITAQEDSAEIERVRASQGEVEAAGLEARLALQRQLPLLIYNQVDALGVALGWSKDLTEEDRKRLQVMIDQGKVALDNAEARAESAARDQLDQEAKRQIDLNKRIIQQQQADFRRAHEFAVQDVADLYERAMRGGVDGIFGHFKDEGLRVIAEIAGQWTLAMIAGNPFDLNAAATGAAARSPLSSIFFGSEVLAAAANDNAGKGISAASSSAAAEAVWGEVTGPPGARAGGASADQLGEIGLAFALAQGGSALAGGQSRESQIGGAVGGAAGFALGSLVGLGPVGAAIGGLFGNLAGGLVGTGAAGSATIGGSGANLGVTGTLGGSGTRREAASQSAGSLIEAINQLAGQLGATVDASRASVSIGLRDDDIRVDPTGRGRTKIGDGAVNFGQDEAAALEFAMRDAINDGVLKGLSQASQNILQRPNTDLERQIEKALMIEQVPDLLRQRLDPLGAALDDVYDRFKLLADALREGGANAEQLAEAQKLYELEKAEAISSIGAASQTLQDFLSSLNAGSNSPLSLRQQRAEAEAQLSPFIEQITDAEAARAEVDRLRAEGGDAGAIEAAEAAARAAAAAIDQSGFTEASQLLLSISRQTNASSGSFFSDFDRIRALTGGAVGLIDSAAPSGSDARDPFSQAIAKNTEDAAYILTDSVAEQRRQTVILEAIARQLGGGGGGGFIREPRAFVN